MGIEIDPKTGAPIVKQDEPVTKPFETSAPVKDMEKEVFNEAKRSEVNSGLADEHNVRFQHRQDKLHRIKLALAHSGGDSMQQERMYDAIKEILGW